MSQLPSKMYLAGRGCGGLKRGGTRGAARGRANKHKTFSGNRNGNGSRTNGEHQQQSLP